MRPADGEDLICDIVAARHRAAPGLRAAVDHVIKFIKNEARTAPDLCLGCTNSGADMNVSCYQIDISERLACSSDAHVSKAHLLVALAAELEKHAGTRNGVATTIGLICCDGAHVVTIATHRTA